MLNRNLFLKVVISNRSKLCYIIFRKLPNSYIVLIMQELLFSYNIAVDRSAEMKRVLGKSAASVGLQLPDVYQG